MNSDQLKINLQSLWKLKGSFEIITAGYSYFLIHDLLEDDRTRNITARPWRIGINPLLVRTWTQNFSTAREANNNVTMTWVNIHYPPIEYSTLEVLILLGNRLGKTVALDGRNTGQFF